MTSDVADRANPAVVEELLEIGREQLLVVVDDVRLTCYFYQRIRIIFKVFFDRRPYRVTVKQAKSQNCVTAL